MANMGAAFAYSTIINAALKGLNNNVNPDEKLSMTDAEVSWLGKFIKRFNSRFSEQSENNFKKFLSFSRQYGVFNKIVRRFNEWMDY